MNIRAIALAAAMCLLGHGLNALGQETVKNDSDPTRPILFSIRPEFYRVDDNAWRMQVVARYDRATLRNRRWLGGKRGLLTRVELPLVAGEAPATATRAGLGDAYAQALAVPKLSGRFAYVIGTGLSFPTATADVLGSGKWILAPAFAPVWFLRGRGIAYVKVQNFVSIAGDRDRPDVNFLLITPTVLHTVGRSSWILLDSETMTDWNRDGRTGVKSGMQFGHMMKNGFGLWLKPEVWWGANRRGNWNLKTGLVWYR